MHTKWCLQIRIRLKIIQTQILLGSPHLPLVFFFHRNTERVFTVFLQHSAPEAAFKLNNLILYEFGCEFV